MSVRWGDEGYSIKNNKWRSRCVCVCVLERVREEWRRQKGVESYKKKRVKKIVKKKKHKKEINRLKKKKRKKKNSQKNKKMCVWKYTPRLTQQQSHCPTFFFLGTKRNKKNQKVHSPSTRLPINISFASIFVGEDNGIYIYIFISFI